MSADVAPVRVYWRIHVSLNVQCSGTDGSLVGVRLLIVNGYGGEFMIIVGCLWFLRGTASFRQSWEISTAPICFGAIRVTRFILESRWHDRRRASTRSRGPAPAPRRHRTLEFSGSGAWPLFTAIEIGSTILLTAGIGVLFLRQISGEFDAGRRADFGRNLRQLRRRYGRLIRPLSAASWFVASAWLAESGRLFLVTESWRPFVPNPLIEPR